MSRKARALFMGDPVRVTKTCTACGEPFDVEHFPAPSTCPRHDHHDNQGDTNT